MGKHGSGIGNLGVLPSQTQKIDDCRRCFVPPTSCCVYLENPVVERDHHQAGDVEGAEAGPDDEVRVVEGADDLFLLLLLLPLPGDVGGVAGVGVGGVLRPVVEAGHDGEADGAAGGPAGSDDPVGGQRVVTVLAVEDGRGDGQEPVQADGHQVEDGGGGAYHVHGQVEVTHCVGEPPSTPVSLKEIPKERKFLPCCSYLQLRTY